MNEAPGHSIRARVWISKVVRLFTHADSTELSKQHFVDKKLVVRVIKGMLLLTPPLFTSKKVIEEMAKKIKEVLND